MSGEWMPIETAPIVDEPNKPTYPRILIAFGKEGVSIAYHDLYYAEGGSGCTNGFAWIEPFSGEPLDLHFSTPPTHWMPLPEPPEEP